MWWNGRKWSGFSGKRSLVRRVRVVASFHRVEAFFVSISRVPIAMAPASGSSPVLRAVVTRSVPKAETVKVRIPAGVDTGSRVRVAGKGNAGKRGGPAGDLYIITNVAPHRIFTRKGDNIYCTIPISLPEAALGAKIEVPTVSGKAQFRIPPGTQSGQVSAS